MVKATGRGPIGGRKTPLQSRDDGDKDRPQLIDEPSDSEDLGKRMLLDEDKEDSFATTNEEDKDTQTDNDEVVESVDLTKIYDEEEIEETKSVKEQEISNRSSDSPASVKK